MPQACWKNAEKIMTAIFFPSARTFLETTTVCGPNNWIIMLYIWRETMLKYMHACSAKAIWLIEKFLGAQMSELHYQTCTSNSWLPSLCTCRCTAQWESHPRALEVVWPRGESGREHCFEPSTDMGFETLKSTGEVMGCDFLPCFHASPDE